MMVAANSRKTSFVWKPKEWKKRRLIHEDITLMHKADAAQLFIVKKVLRHTKRSAGMVKNFEIRALSALPNCNRIVPMLGYVENDPEVGKGTIFYDYYPLGDLYNWKCENFDAKNFKTIPESYIWRFFIQMSQALGFIHNRLGPGRDERDCIIHRDIKPKNVLVVSNGSTYPSFKLHDFGCGTFYSDEKSAHNSYCGTFEWQPPENPKINTTAADVWALGACVYFMALGNAPIMSRAQYAEDLKMRHGDQPPKAAGTYDDVDRYCAARVPRNVLRINWPEEEQRRRGIAPRESKPHFNPVYSDELDAWMCATLAMEADKRATVRRLIKRMIPDARGILKQIAGDGGLVDLDISF